MVYKKCGKIKAQSLSYAKHQIVSQWFKKLNIKNTRITLKMKILIFPRSRKRVLTKDNTAKRLGEIIE